MTNNNSINGFSLAEMLVAVAIIGIVAGMFVQQFSDFQGSFKRSDAKQTFESDVLRIRNEAVSKGARALLVLNSTGDGYTAGLDYVPYSSSGSIDNTIFQRSFPYGVTATLSQSIIFDTRGYLIDLSGTFTTTAVTMMLDGNTFYTPTVFTTGAIQ